MKALPVVMVLAMLATSWTMGADRQVPLEKVAEIRRLSRDAAASALPVHLSGVCVASFLQEMRAFVLHDGIESIWIRLPSGKLDVSAIRRGARLDILGVTDPAAYAPAIRLQNVRYLGESPLPAPRHPELENLLAGSEDCQWIEVEGVVQATYPADTAWLGALLLLDGLPCRLGTNRNRVPEFSKLVDARIRVRGIFTPDVNSRSEAALLKINVTDPATDIDVLEPPPKDPFLAPRVTASRLMPFSPDSLPGHRRVISGVVTFAVANRFFFLQDGNLGVRVDSPCKVTRGQRVDVSGFVDTQHTFASLRNAKVRVLGTEIAPAAVTVTAAQLLDPTNRSDWGKPQATDFGGRRVKLTGVLRRVDQKSGNQPLSLLIESDNTLFFARIPDDNALANRWPDGWNAGAMVDVEGGCDYEFPEKGDAVYQYGPTGFSLWLASPDDVHILKSAPWWTATRLFTALGGVLLALGMVVFWSLSLRRQVRWQVGMIESKSRLAAAESERVRIARDLHDDIGSELSGIAMLADLVKRDAGPELSRNPRLAEIAAHAHRTVRNLEEIVWAINPANDTVERFASYLCRTVQAYLALAGVPARFDLPEIFPDCPLHGRLRHNLFLAAKEAVHNAVRHGAPTKIICTIDLSGAVLTLTIEDNGCGFEEQASAGASQGTSNMRARMEAIGGTFTRESELGKGTTVRLSISLTEQTS